MSTRDTIYLLACAIPPVLGCAFLCSFAFGDFVTSWLCAFLMVLAAETRVQAGGRLPHTPIFWLHLSASVPFFLSLSTLAFAFLSPFLVLIAALSGLIVFYSGGILWYRGLWARMLH